MAAKEVRRLRSVNDLNDANEHIFHGVENKTLDGKTADSMNTIVKNATYLNVKLPMDYLKLYVTANIKKIDIPVAMLPEGMKR